MQHRVIHGIEREGLDDRVAPDITVEGVKHEPKPPPERKPSPGVREKKEPREAREPREPRGDAETALDGVGSPPLTPGRIVHFNIGVTEPVLRPAIYIGDGWLRVFLVPHEIPPAGAGLTIRGFDGWYAQDAAEGLDCGTWRWPERT